MNKPASKGKHINVLMHIMGYLKKKINTHDKQELLDYCKAYRENKVPIISLIILLQHHLRVYPDAYLAQQHYLNPFPMGIAQDSST